MPSVAVILPAAGRSSRYRDKEKKPFVNLDGRAVWLRSVELFINRAEVKQCLIVVSPDDQEMFRRRFGANLAFMDLQIAPGGAERFESVANALKMLKPEIDFVAIHDAVRPCVTESLVTAVFTRAFEKGAAMLAVPVNDTVKSVNDKNQITGTVSRKGLWLAQTPQVFRRDWLEDAYAQRKGGDITDDAQLVEAIGESVHVVEGASSNIKITTRGDLALADAILKSAPKPKVAGPMNPFGEDEMWGGKGLR